MKKLMLSAVALTVFGGLTLPVVGVANAAPTVAPSIARSDVATPVKMTKHQMMMMKKKKMMMKKKNMM